MNSKKADRQEDKYALPVWKERPRYNCKVKLQKHYLVQKLTSTFAGITPNGTTRQPSLLVPSLTAAMRKSLPQEHAHPTSGLAYQRKPLSELEVFLKAHPKQVLPRKAGKVDGSMQRAHGQNWAGLSIPAAQTKEIRPTDTVDSPRHVATAKQASDLSGSFWNALGEAESPNIFFSEAEQSRHEREGEFSKSA